MATVSDDEVTVIDSSDLGAEIKADPASVYRGDFMDGCGQGLVGGDNGFAGNRI